MGYNVGDKEHQVSKALPATNETIYTGKLDLGALSAKGARVADCELIIHAPALPVGELPNTNTMKYDVQTDSDSAFGSPKTIAATVLTQTGGDGAGAAAAELRFRLPTDCERYVRVAATASNDNDASGSDVSVELAF